MHLLRSQVICCRKLAFISQTCFCPPFIWHYSFFIRSSGSHGDLHPQTGNLHPKWRQCASSAGQIVPLKYSTIFIYLSYLLYRNVPPLHAVYPYSVFRYYNGVAFGFDSRMFNAFVLSYPRKCLITWKRKEMQAFSRVSQDWCSLAGTDLLSIPQKGPSVQTSSAYIWLVSFFP